MGLIDTVENIDEVFFEILKDHTSGSFVDEKVKWTNLSQKEISNAFNYLWENYGKKNYSKANSILALADGGGSNSSRHYIFKENLQNLTNEIGIEIRMAHYPPYTSKYNPIEHRLFCHVTSAFKVLSSAVLM